MLTVNVDLEKLLVSLGAVKENDSRLRRRDESAEREGLNDKDDDDDDWD